MALIKCKECGGTVSNKAKSCPSCGAEVPQGTSTLTWVLAALFAFVVFSCAFKQPAPKPPITPEKLAQEKELASISNAKWACRQYVEPLLKAPSTAKFQNYNEFSWDRYAVRGYVDAQNSFGAQIRTHFTCHMTPDGEKWIVGAASID